MSMMLRKGIPTYLAQAVDVRGWKKPGLLEPLRMFLGVLVIVVKA
jgi:hypothetical protein